MGEEPPRGKDILDLDRLRDVLGDDAATREFLMSVLPNMAQLCARIGTTAIAKSGTRHAQHRTSMPFTDLVPVAQILDGRSTPRRL